MGGCANRDGFVWFPLGWDIRIICVTIFIFLTLTMGVFRRGGFKVPIQREFGQIAF